MADVAGLPVKGYAPTQSQAAIDAVNQLKVLEEKYLRYLDLLISANGPSDLDGALYDPRWLAIARTHIQEGTMAAARAIFKPQRLEGDL